VVEQRPFKPKVVGSIPTAPTNAIHLTTIVFATDTNFGLGPPGLFYLEYLNLACGPRARLKGCGLPQVEELDVPKKVKTFIFES
jgi:hypothetical protein